MARMWHDDDVSLGPIKGETIAVIGYGIQGAAQASNLRDSGLKVVVGLREGGKSWAKAKSEGHKVMTVPDAVKKADIVHILIPDMEQARIYKQEIKPNFQKGAALSFSHGAAIHWKWIVPPKQSDVIMVAPKSPGQRVRELYLENFGTPVAGRRPAGLHEEGLGAGSSGWPRASARPARASCRPPSRRRSRATGSGSRWTSAEAWRAW